MNDYREKLRHLVTATEPPFDAGAISLSLFNAGVAAHKGLLFSLWLDPGSAAQLAMPGGEPADKLHVTLCYCGDVAALGDVAIANAIVAASEVASGMRPFASTITGVGTYDATPQSDDLDVIHAKVECPTLRAFRAQLAEALVAAGCPPRADFEYHPHITLAYVDPGSSTDVVPPALTLEFNALTISVGDLRSELPFYPIKSIRVLDREGHYLAAIGPDGKGPYGKESRGSDYRADKAKRAVDKLDDHPNVANAKLSPLTAYGDEEGDGVWTSVRESIQSKMDAAGGFGYLKGRSTQEEDVPLTKVTTFQRWVNTDTVRRYADQVGSSDRPLGYYVEFDGKKVLVDGNHRVAAAKLGGATKVRLVRLLSAIGPDGKGPYGKESRSASLDKATRATIAGVKKAYAEKYGDRLNRIIDTYSRVAEKMARLESEGKTDEAEEAFGHRAALDDVFLDIETDIEKGRSPDEVKAQIEYGESVADFIEKFYLNPPKRIDNAAIGPDGKGPYGKLPRGGVIRNKATALRRLATMRGKLNAEEFFPAASNAEVRGMPGRSTRAQERASKTIDVPMSALRSTQTFLDNRVVERYIRKGYDKPPLAAWSTDGSKRVVIEDGHHRGAAEKLSGAKTLRVRVIEYQPTELVQELRADRIDLPVVEDVRHVDIIGAVKPKKRKPIVWRGLKLSRTPTVFEQRVLSLAAIPERMTTETDLAVDALVSCQLSQLETWTAGEIPANAEVVEVLCECQRRIARYGAFELRQECRRQGLAIETPADDDPIYAAIEGEVSSNANLAMRVLLTSDQLYRGWQLNLQQISLRVKRAKERTSSNLTDEIREIATQGVSQGLKGAVQQVLHEAFAFGRATEMRRLHRGEPISLKKRTKEIDDDTAESLVDYVIQTAVMDANTCDPCADADGQVFEYDSDEQIEHEPPYFRCLGGGRCRCEQLYVLKVGGSWLVRGE